MTLVSLQEFATFCSNIDKILYAVMRLKELKVYEDRWTTFFFMYSNRKHNFNFKLTFFVKQNKKF